MKISPSPPTSFTKQMFLVTDFHINNRTTNYFLHVIMWNFHRHPRSQSFSYEIWERTVNQAAGKSSEQACAGCSGPKPSEVNALGLQNHHLWPALPPFFPRRLRILMSAECALNISFKTKTRFRHHILTASCDAVVVIRAAACPKGAFRQIRKGVPYTLPLSI